MNIISRIKNVLSNTEKSKKGVTCTRRLCVGDIDEQYIWFEVCDKNKEDYQCQYPVPIKDIRYNKEQINELEKLDIDDKYIQS